MERKLAYSSLTDEVFYLDGKGRKTLLPENNFIQMVLLWLTGGTIPKVGERVERTLSVNSKIHWKITCERVAE